MALVTEIIADPLRFAALADDWDKLATSQEGTALTLHDWYSAAFAAQAGAKCRLHVIAIWDGPRLAAAAPLMRDAARGPARLVPIDAFAGELDRLLHNSAAALAALVRACADTRQPLLLRRLAATPADIAALSTGLRGRAAVYCQPHRASAAVRLPPVFAQLEADMSSNRRSSIRRKWRAAETEHGRIEAEFIRPNPRDLAADLARIEAVEGSGWKRRAGTAIASDRRMREFITRAALAFARHGRLMLAFLKIGGQDAACRLILQQGTAWFEIKIGYDARFARFSPGVLLMHETLREACRQQIASYAFLGVYEGWQDHWPNTVMTDHRLATYPFNPAGGMALAADGARALALLIRRRRR